MELIERHIIPTIGTILLSKLTTADVKLMLATLSTKTGRAGKPLSPTTVSHCRNVLRTALADAVEDKLIAANPAAGRKKGWPQAVDRPRDALRPEQAEALITATHDDPLGPLYATLLWSGMRLGEAMALTWHDVDLEPGGMIRIRRTYGVVGGVARFAEPKTKGSRRDVPKGEALDALRDQRRRQAEARLLAGPYWTDQGLVFANATGGQLDPRQITKRLHLLLAPIGLEHLRVHDLRHGFASFLLRQGVSILVVAKLLGHVNATMLLRVYGHTSVDELQAAAESLTRMRTVAS